MSNQTELQKEFELERMILFSDAVFAIALTLLIIEIKFPDIAKGATREEIWHEFKPTIIHFAGFVFSFFFTGLMWSRHLKTFKYLRSYNNGVIFRNLVLLFFIVCFPFTASGLSEHIRPSFLLPIYIYIVNLVGVSISTFLLCHYIFKTKPHLSVAGFQPEKNYLVMQTKYSAIILTLTLVVVIILSIVFPGNTLYILYGFYVTPIMMILSRRRLKKYKPAKTEI